MKTLNKQMLILTTKEDHYFLKKTSLDLDVSMSQLIRLMIKRIKEEKDFIQNNISIKQEKDFFKENFH